MAALSRNRPGPKPQAGSLALRPARGAATLVVSKTRPTRHIYKSAGSARLGAFVDQEVSSGWPALRAGFSCSSCKAPVHQHLGAKLEDARYWHLCCVEKSRLTDAGQ